LTTEQFCPLEASSPRPEIHGICVCYIRWCAGGHDQLREWYGSPEPESGDRVSVYRPVADYLFNTLESFDPPSTPAVEIRVVPMRNLYVKSMVAVAVRSPFSQNPTGLVPQFNGTPVSTSEIGFTPAKKRLRCEPSTVSRAARVTQGYISLALRTIQASFRVRQVRSRTLGTSSSTGWRARSSGALTRKVERDWMLYSRTTPELIFSSPRYGRIAALYLFFDKLP